MLLWCVRCQQTVSRIYILPQIGKMENELNTNVITEETTGEIEKNGLKAIENQLFSEKLFIFEGKRRRNQIILTFPFESF